MMHDERRESSLALHALMDGELDDERRREVLARVAEDPALARELCDLRRVKELIQFAWPEPAPMEEPAPPRRRSGGAALAAGLAAVAFLAGCWVAPRLIQPEGFRLADVEQDPSRVLLYVGESDPQRFRRALAKARQLMERHGGREAEVYLVTSAGGVDLLRTATSPLADEIRALKTRYPALHFVACNNTLFNLRRKGLPVKLVQEAEVAPSAVGFVVDHLKRGWTFLTI